MFQSGLLICMLVLSLPLAFGAEGPAPELLRAQFEQNLPSGWELRAFNIEASENYGTAVEPEFKHRFNAPIELVGDTFVEAAKEGPVTLLTRVGRGGEQRVVYGISTAVREAGSWAVTFEFENDPTAGMGKSRDFFSGRLIVKGSKDETTYLRQQQRDAEVQHKAQLAKIARQAEIEEAERQAVREAELAQSAHEAQMRGKERQITAQELAKLDARMQAMGKELIDDLKNHVALEISGYWRLVNFTVGRVAHSGTYQEPVFEHDFEIKVELEQNTFTMAEQEGSVTVVEPIAKAGDTKTIYGKSTASTANGGWDIELDLEGFDSLSAGQPQDVFSGRVIVQGSEDEEAYRAELEAEATALETAEFAALEREQNLAEQEYQAELAQQAREAKIRQRETEQATKQLADLKAILEGDDPDKRRLALSNALSSDDRLMRETALRHIFSASKTWPVELHTAGDETAQDYLRRFGPLALVVEKVMTTTGQVAGHFFSESLDQEDEWKFAGKVIGDNFSANSWDCGINLSLTDEAKMEGRFQCSSGYAQYPMTATVTLQ